MITGNERWGGAFQAIRLTAGEHRVRFEFGSVSAGIVAINVVAVCALFVLAWTDARSRRKGLAHRPDSLQPGG
jgi:hypothetical protein